MSTFRWHHHRLLIPLAAVIACLPLLVQGSSCGHDFDFHLLSWLEAATQLTHGAFPHWAFTPAWNAGEPRFLFYPPLSWLLGAALGLVLPWPLVPAALTFVILTLAGFTMHRLARPYLDAPRATLAAALYLANPYTLFTAYERTAYGELLAAAFIPLLLAAILTPRPRILPLAAPVALIWLANAPAGVMSCYALALLTLARLITSRLRRDQTAPGLTPCPIHDSLTVISGPPQPFVRTLATITAGTLLGLALASAYLLPAAVEQPLISSQLAVVEGMRIQDSMPFHPMSATTHTSAADAALHNAVLLQASQIALNLFLSIALATVLHRRLSVNLCATSVPSVFVLPFPTTELLTLTTAILLLLTPLTLPLWHHLPELRFLQFPWRLLALVGPAFALFVARATPSLKLPALPLLLTAALVFPAWHLFAQPCDDEDNVLARVALFHSNRGTDQTDEYTPANADEDALKPGAPPYWLGPSATSPPPPHVTPGQAPADLTLTPQTPTYLILNRRLYPLWQLQLNGRTVPLDSARPDGLIALPIPAGLDHITLREHRTPDEDCGLALTLAAGGLSLALWRKQRQEPSHNAKSAM